MLGNIGNRVFLALGLSLAFFSFSMFGGLDAEFWCSPSGSARNDICDSCRSVSCLSDSSFLSPSVAFADGLFNADPAYDVAAGWYPPPTDGYYLFDGYNLPMPGEGVDGYWTFTDTEGAFHNWEVTGEQGFRQTFYEYLRVVLPTVPDFTAYMQTVQTDYIVGVYRLLFYYFESCNGGLYSIYDGVHDLYLPLVTMSDYLDDIQDDVSTYLPSVSDISNIYGFLSSSNGLGTVIGGAVNPVLRLIEDNTDGLETSLSEIEDYTYTLEEYLPSVNSSLLTVSGDGRIIRYAVDNVETLLQGILDALEDLSIQVDVSTDFDGDFDGNVNVTNLPYTASQYLIMYQRIAALHGWFTDLISIGDDIYLLLENLVSSLNHSFDSAFIGDLSQLNAFSYGQYIALSGVRNSFPYSLIYLPYDFFESLPDVEPLCPSVTVPLPVGLTGLSTLTVSLQQFESLRPVIHFTSMLLLMLALLFSTRKILFTGR